MPTLLRAALNSEISVSPAISLQIFPFRVIFRNFMPYFIGYRYLRLRCYTDLMLHK